jgi:hypothetical protein
VRPAYPTCHMSIAIQPLNFKFIQRHLKLKLICLQFTMNLRQTIENFREQDVVEQQAHHVFTDWVKRKQQESKTSTHTRTSSISRNNHTPQPIFVQTELLDSIKHLSSEEIEQLIKRLQKNKKSYDAWVEKKELAQKQKAEMDVLALNPRQ